MRKFIYRTIAGILLLLAFVGVFFAIASNGSLGAVGCFLFG
jgi:membrane-bound ClpP family serine protease